MFRNSPRNCAARGSGGEGCIVHGFCHNFKANNLLAGGNEPTPANSTQLNLLGPRQEIPGQWVGVQACRWIQFLESQPAATGPLGGGKPAP